MRKARGLPATATPPTGGQEFENFKELTRKLVQVSKTELDEERKRSENGRKPPGKGESGPTVVR
jgi:hypothetical protein